MEPPPSPAWAVPFLLMVLATATLPLVWPRWWEHNLNKFWVSLALGASVSAYYLSHNPHVVLAVAEEFLSFILLLASLYIVTGGILLTGDLRATPQTNTAFLAVGTLLASLIGTTGASLLMLRPLLQTNQERVHRSHTVIFFIFLVSNIGGCLTPLGDPPLFMGYLEGVPFRWTLGLFPAWLFVGGVLLAVYFVWDTVMFSREPIAALERDKLMIKPLRLAGSHNFGWLLAILLAVAFLKAPIREAVLVAVVAISLRLTPRELHRANKFSYAPIIEVAILFFGIFMTMNPALDLLRIHAGQFGIREPWHFFWATGGLSSFLDNAPTYLAFFNLARGLSLPDEVAGMSEAALRAISLGAVFMGANTYIGNAPNLMVRAVAEESKVKMPGFFGYMGYSLAVLIPIFVVVTVMFL